MANIRRPRRRSSPGWRQGSLVGMRLQLGSSGAANDKSAGSAPNNAASEAPPQLPITSQLRHDPLVDLAQAVQAAERTILFAQTRAAAAAAVEKLGAVGVRGEVLDATMDMSLNRSPRRIRQSLI